MGKLIVRIYKGEDFPQLDSRNLSLRKGSAVEDLVDPYCVVSYGGHVAKTPVKKNNYDPEWNYQISFPFQVRTIVFLSSLVHAPELVFVLMIFLAPIYE